MGQSVLLPMGIMDRLGNVIKSYINDFSGDAFKGSSPRSRFNGKSSDPDFNAAYEELDDFLNKKDGWDKSTDPPDSSEQKKPKDRPMPAELLKDFAELGVSPDAAFEECKAAYKELLKIHHPDKHSRHEGNMKKATEKSARVNAAYNRLESWFKTS